MSERKSIFDSIFRKEKTVNTSESVQTLQNPASLNPEDYISYMSQCTGSNYSGMMIETKYIKPDKHIKTFEEQVPIIYDTLEQTYKVSNVHYFIRREGTKFLCYLNFEEYNIRVLTEFIKQLLTNNTEYILYNVYYASVSDNSDEIYDELDFLYTMPAYSMIFGYNKKIRAFYFKDCESASFQFNIQPLQTALKDNDLECAIGYLLERKDDFVEIIHTSYRCSFKRMYDFLLDTYFSLLEYYNNPDMPGPKYSEDFDAYLTSFEDATFFLDKMCEDLQDYANKYPAYRNLSIENDLINEARLYILNNIRDVTLQSVATHFNVSYAHLSRLFKKNTKRNFTDYVSELKLDMAEKYLEEGVLSIQDITDKLGYSSPSYFLTKFKERNGVTPSVYRKEYFIKNSNK